MTDVELYGLKAGGHHLTNLFFHIANVLLLFFLLNRTTGALWRSFAVAALFAVHPLHVESVAWISERKDVLSAFFLLLTLHAYCRYVQARSIGKYLCVMGLFIAGLMAKPMLVSLPIMLLLLDFWPLRRMPCVMYDARTTFYSKARLMLAPAAKLAVEKVPLFVLSAVSSVITILAQKSEHAFMAIPFMTRMSNAALSYAHYLYSAFIPINLSVYYPYNDAIDWRKPAMAAIILIVVTAIALWQKNKRPWITAGWLWYLCTLLPVIGIVQVGGQARADRYTYIPLIGIFLILAWGARDIVKNNRLRTMTMYVLAVLFLGAAATIARFQVTYWNNSITLFSHAIRVTKANCMAQVNLSSAFFNMEDNYDSAMYHCKESLRIKPTYWSAYNAGIMLGKLKNFIGALGCFSEAVKLEPTHAEAYVKLGDVEHMLKNDSAAIVQLKTAIGLDPRLSEAYHTMALIMYEKDNYDQSIHFYKKELALDQQSWDAYNGLGLAYGKQHDFQRAFVSFLDAIHFCKESSGEPYYNFANLLMTIGKTNAAKALYSHTLRLTPLSARAYYCRGRIYSLQGVIDSALADFQKAVHLQPDFMVAQEGLADMFKKNASPDSAEMHLKAARAVYLLQPDARINK
jgi:tetratricopeptide (TPR) repeat protein